MNDLKNIFTKKLILDIFFLIAIPAIFIYVLFWFQVDIPLTSDSKKLVDAEDSKGDLAVMWEIDREDLGWRKMFRDIFQVPFDLTYYKLPLENRSYRERGELGNTPVSVIVKFYSLKNTSMNDDEISFKNAEHLFDMKMEAEETKYTSAIKSSNFMYAPIVEMGDIKNVDSRYIAKPLFKVQIASSIIFLFVWWGAYLLVLKVYSLLSSFIQYPLKLIKNPRKTSST